ncbi:MAG TPA: FtsX-like permease family protein [Magnetospirillaceae bacterium]|jgi:putative ABC transport system permease protein
MLFKIALRNILRNRRRSTMTISAIAVGAMAMLLFGAFTTFVILGIRTTTIDSAGHLTVLRTGYFAFGTGNPSAYGIPDYEAVMKTISDDPEIGPKLAVITPSISLFGIAGNFSADSSRTFIGSGVVPSDRKRMREWNEYHLGGGRRLTRPPSPLSDDDITKGVIGLGLARTLSLCAPLHVADCPAAPEKKTAAVAGAAPAPDLADLTAQDTKGDASANDNGMPRIDLLSATAGGAPNVVTISVAGTEQQPAKELDDGFVGMHLKLAQQLVYGRGEHKVTSIVLQLKKTEDMAAVRTRLEALFKDKGLDLEVHDFTEFNPMYKQIVQFFGAIFSFIALIMIVIVLFTVVNTMSMSVMERTNEIGTTRALGVRRSGIRRQFLAEGWLLGFLGATLGVILAAIIAAIVNHAGLTWQPPGQSGHVPLYLYLAGAHGLIIATWVILVVVATIAALVPASRAARMAVVDALRHV